MINQQQQKSDIDKFDDVTLSIASKPLISSKSITNFKPSSSADNLLKNSVIHEEDIMSPIDEVWDVDQ